jgi:ATP-dependent Clp protease ATP-binding subunit ClpA
MLNKFTGEARMVVGDAVDVARELGSPTIEAEHLLLAVAREMPEAGLDYETLLEALDAERTLSLAAVGVALEPPPHSPPVGQPRFATSAKLALERALRAAVARGDKRIEGRHVALGVLRAQFGTVPRALAFAGLDHDELIAALDA